MFLWYFGKNVPAFCLYPKNLLKAKFKSTLLNFLAEEISEQSDIDFVILLLIITPLEDYNEKEWVGQKKYKIYCLENERTSKFLMKKHQNS